MERHIQRRNHDLDEGKMRKSLTKLKTDLGISTGSTGSPIKTTPLVQEKNSPREVKSSSMTSVFSSNVSANPVQNEPSSAHDLKEALATTLQNGKPSSDVSVTSQGRQSATASVKSAGSKIAAVKKSVSPVGSVGSATGKDTTNARKPSSDGSDDESDYGSVAALSMALKPGAKFTLNTEKKKTSSKSVMRDESRDITDKSESTVKEESPLDKTTSYADDFDDDF